MTVGDANGPGWVKTKTGSAATEATTIYMEAVFPILEEDVSQMWLCVAQPSTPTAYTTDGW